MNCENNKWGVAGISRHPPPDGRTSGRPTRSVRCRWRRGEQIGSVSELDSLNKHEGLARGWIDVPAGVSTRDPEIVGLVATVVTGALAPRRGRWWPSLAPSREARGRTRQDSHQNARTKARG